LLIVTELVLRWRILRGVEEARDHVVEKSYLPAAFKANYSGVFWGIPFRTNRYGFRDEPDFPKEPAEDETRVLSLGDSIGFGLGVQADEHYTKVLQRELMKRSSKPVRVINAGGQGYSPSGYYVYLRHEGLSFQPDLVLVETELCNDITDEALLTWAESSEHGYLNKVVGGRYRVSWDGNLLGTYSLAGWHLEATYTYTLLVRRILNLLFRISPPEPWKSRPEASIYYTLGFDRYVLDETTLEMGRRRLGAALKGAAKLLEDRRIPLVVLLMPSRYLYEQSGAYSQLAQALFQGGLASTREAGLVTFDISRPIAQSGGAALFFDFAHLTAAGNEAVGRYLAQNLAHITEGDDGSLEGLREAP
jgi:hypothetical protein